MRGFPVFPLPSTLASFLASPPGEPWLTNRKAHRNWNYCFEGYQDNNHHWEQEALSRNKLQSQDSVEDENCCLSPNQKDPYQTFCQPTKSELVLIKESPALWFSLVGISWRKLQTAIKSFSLLPAEGYNPLHEVQCFNKDELIKSSTLWPEDKPTLSNNLSVELFIGQTFFQVKTILKAKLEALLCILFLESLDMY